MTVYHTVTIILSYCYTTLLNFFLLYLYVIHLIVSILNYLKYFDLFLIKKRINLNYLTFCLASFCCLTCCNIVLLCFYAMFWDFFHLYLYAIYQTILIISFIKYFDLLIMKKLINLNNPPCYCHYTIISLYFRLLDLLYLHLCAIYWIISIISYQSLSTIY